MSEPLTVPRAILARRAVRKFDPNRPLPEDLLVGILGLATHAPSSYNLQPWRFLVVRSERNRQRLRACAYNQPKITEAPVVVIVLGYTRGYETDLAPMLDRRVALGGMRPEVAAEAKGRALASLGKHRDLPSWALRSAMLAAGAMMIAAQGLGVDSAPMEGFDAGKIKQEFGVPDDHVVCCLVCLGYALERDPFPGRFGLEHVCYEEHFGQPWTLGQPPPAG
ncbi:MAG TPA: nitroreductase family protein [Isosphaeraceae bacterium]